MISKLNLTRYVEALSHSDAGTREIARCAVAKYLDEMREAVAEYREKINHPALDDKTRATMQEIIDEYDKAKRRFDTA